MYKDFFLEEIKTLNAMPGFRLTNKYIEKLWGKFCLIDQKEWAKMCEIVSETCEHTPRFIEFINAHSKVKTKETSERTKIIDRFHEHGWKKKALPTRISRQQFMQGVGILEDDPEEGRNLIKFTKDELISIFILAAKLPLDRWIHVCKSASHKESTPLLQDILNKTLEQFKNLPKLETPPKTEKRKLTAKDFGLIR